ncbi:MAG: serine/threonine protein kinase, partial [Pyrinomonadaceae bacterium]
MDSARWSEIKMVFSSVVELPTDERNIAMRITDPEVRVEVEKLLSAHENAVDFIDTPVLVKHGVVVEHAGEEMIGKQVDHYRIVEKIGSGGMGQVYLATRDGFDDNVAIKLIKRGMDSDAILKRFFLERRILSRLKHPNIAGLLDGGTTEDGLPYFVMEYVEGLPLIEFCDAHRFDADERLEIFRNVCAAVSYAHQHLIVHRDLKPGNILVTADGTPKLLDFGIAKLLEPDAENTATQARIFTPEYASPEQLNGLPITTSADVFSLGAILYELLSGTRPFASKGNSYREIANLVLTSEPRKPSSFLGSGSFLFWDTKADEKQTQGEITSKTRIGNSKALEGDLDNIILKALRKEPERRYLSVQEFSEDIRRRQVGLPVTATADSAAYRFRKFVGRNRIGTAIAGLILALTAFSGWQAVVATRERAKAERSFAELRRSAHELMTETNAALSRIQGSTLVRKNIVERSVAMLDSIAAEDTNDVSLLAELADGYLDLGRIEHFEFREFQNAQESILKSIKLRRRILA